MPGRIRDFLEAETLRSKRYGGRHTYTAEQFGLTREELRTEFADYEAMFIAD